MDQAEEKSVLKNWAAPLPLPAFQERAVPSAGGSAAQGAASVNVLSLGFAATAILLSLFLLMALFERFLRPAPPPPPPSPPPAAASAKLRAPSLPPCDPFVGVSVVMPGHSIPTFIANPAPLLSHHHSVEAAAMTRPGGCCSTCIHTSFPTSSFKSSLQEQQGGLPLPISTSTGLHH